MGSLHAEAPVTLLAKHETEMLIEAPLAAASTSPDAARMAALQLQAAGAPAATLVSGVCRFICCGLCCKCGRVTGDMWGVEIPRSPEELRQLGPDWVTQALRANSAISADNACTSLDVQPLGATGVFGEMILCTWTFEKDADVPPQVVCKFPPATLYNRLVGTGADLFLQELHYYMFCQPASVVMSPKLIFGEMDYRSRDFIIFMEKIDGTRNFLEDTVTAKECEEMMRAVGKFHRPWVGRSDAAAIAWVSRPDNGDFDPPPWWEGDKSSIYASVRLLMTSKAWRKSGECIRSDVASKEARGEVVDNAARILLEVFDEITPRFEDVRAQFTNVCRDMADQRLGWRGLQHGDTRADNFYFPPDQEATGIIDFQLMMIGDIAKDIAYAMATSTPTELWEPEQPEQRDSGGTQQMLNAYFEGLAIPALTEPELRAEFIEMIGLHLCLQANWLISQLGNYWDNPSDRAICSKMDSNLCFHYRKWTDTDESTPMQIFDKYLRGECRFQTRALLSGWTLPSRTVR
jgi:tRNA A-37 threonylcarbamoyl transferase component Bud32